MCNSWNKFFLSNALILFIKKMLITWFQRQSTSASGQKKCVFHYGLLDKYISSPIMLQLVEF